MSKYIVSVFLIVCLTTISIKAWNGLTASQGDKLDYQKWNELVATVQSGIPTGAVMAFDLPSCPDGWTAYSAGVGRTIIGAGNGAGSTTSVGDTGGEKSAPTVTGSVSVKGMSTSTSGNINIPSGTNNTIGRINGSTSSFYPSNASDVSFPAATFTAGGTAPDNMQPYVSLLYCKKS